MPLKIVKKNVGSMGEMTPLIVRVSKKLHPDFWRVTDSGAGEANLRETRYQTKYRCDWGEIKRLEGAMVTERENLNAIT